MPPFAICKFVSCPDPPLLLTIRRCTPACAVVSDQNGTSRVEQFSAVVTEATDRSVNQLANDCPVATVFAALRDLRRQMSVCLPDLWPPRPRTWQRSSACAASRSGRMTSCAGHCPACSRRLGSIRQSVPLGILSLWVIGLVSSSKKSSPVADREAMGAELAGGKHFGIPEFALLQRGLTMQQRTT